MNYKKTAVVLAAVTLLTTMAVTANAPYKDMNSVTNTSAVNYLYDCRCLNFVKSDHFLPNQAMTRGEVAQLLYDGMAQYQQSTTWVKDITSQASQDAVGAVVKRGVMQVYPDGTFHSGDLVTREDFAVMLYNYLHYFQMADADGTVAPYGDSGQIGAKDLPMVQVLKSKNIMTSKDNLFRPKDTVTREEAVSAVYHMTRSDDYYVSHVAVETAVLKCLSAEYGSPQLYFNIGTLYWQGDTLILAMKGQPSKLLKQRLAEEVHPRSAVAIRTAQYSRADYDLMMNRVIRTLVKAEGVRNYVGSRPDYAHQQLIVMVRRPVEASVVDKINKTVGAGFVRIEVVSALGKSAANRNETAFTQTKVPDVVPDKSGSIYTHP